MTESGTAYIPTNYGSADEFLVFNEPVDVIRADRTAEVREALDGVMRGVRLGLKAVGWIAYEAAPAFDPALTAHPQCPAPLVWFGLYRGSRRVTPGELERYSRSFRLGAWKPTISKSRYFEDIARIRARLKAGETYQVNHTMRLRALFDGDPSALFLALYRAQPSPNAMYIDAGELAIASASPELFVHKRGNTLTSRPMKGTLRRAPGGGGGEAQDVERLRCSGKQRAENVMIVDMIRNDMGRIAEPGSVNTRRLFEVESYPTVLQMTSTVKARTAAQWPEIMRAMFPCASVTGAPKVSAMSLIAGLETTPRGVYTGCMGYISRPTAFRFNVAIRTVSVYRNRHTAEYGVGGGIVWDSLARQEYRECLDKAAVLNAVRGNQAAL